MRRAFYIGVVLGGILGIAVALSMDLVLGKTLGGGWGEAVANDLNRIFNTSYSPDSLIVILGVIIVVGIIGAFGSFVGGVFSVMIARIFKSLMKER